MKMPTARSRPGRIALALAVTVAFAGSAAIALPAAAADDPVNLALASGEQAPAVAVSYVTGWNSDAALNDGASAATNTYTQMWGTWGAPDSPTEDWATYTWDEPVTVSSSTLFLWQNRYTGDAGVMIPQAWGIEYRTQAGEWAPVTGTGLGYPLPVLDDAAPVASLPPVTASFDPVTTTAVRLVLDRVLFDGQRRATSVIEWEVWGVPAPPEEPEPEPTEAYLDAEQVAVRTATGTAPELPEQIWVIGEDGPLTYVDVEWADVAEADYASSGAFEVRGVPDGFSDQPITGVVHVVDTLSATIESIDYAVSITTPGVAPVLPGTVLARYDDATADSTVAVDWERIEPSAYAEADAIFDVPGEVVGFDEGAVATVFVVAPAQQSGPIVSISVDSAPQGSGWYTSAPTVTIDAEPTSSPVVAVEYSLDGETWAPYTVPFVLDEQGEITVLARATAADDSRGEASEEVRIDTVAPETGIDWVVVDGTSARVTLTPSDAEPGSGVTRTVWSDGPDPSPTGETNNMYATYEAPFSVQLTAEPRYVHLQSQDAAGNIESYVTVELPTLIEDSLDLEVKTAERCAAGKSLLVVSVRNLDDVAAEVSVQTPFGTKTLASVASGVSVTTTFVTRTVGVAAGVAKVAGMAGDLSFSEEVAYPAFSCG